MANTETLTIDTLGRLVIPKHVRSQMGLKPGVPMHLQISGDTLTLSVQHDQPEVIRDGDFMVLAGGADFDVTQTLDRLRTQRTQSLF